jgi:hypothetical protein
MDTPTQNLARSQCWPRKSLIVEFLCPAHLKDSIMFCQTTGQEEELMLAISRIIKMFISDASGTHGFTGGPDGPEPPVKGEVVRLQFGPDSPSRPSFTWFAQKVLDKPGAKSIPLLHGGLLYRDNEGWSIHT